MSIGLNLNRGKVMGNHEQYTNIPVPSDFLLDKYNTLHRSVDLGDIVGELDNLQHEAMNLAFQDGFEQGELNVLRQFVEGKLDKDFILEMFGDKLGEVKCNI